MGLRRQLLIISLLTLCLPWAGILYIGEMEGILQQGHLRALKATTSAVATRVSHDEKLLARIEPNKVRYDQAIMYAHPARQQFIVDGYFDAWENSAHSSLNLGENGDKFSAKVWVAANADYLFIFLKTHDNSADYYEPGLELHKVDHVEIRFNDSDNNSRLLRIFTEAPGEANIFNERGQRNFRVQAHWMVNSTSGYQLEIKFPRALIGDEIGLTLFDGSFSKPLSYPTQESLAKIIAHDDLLTEALAVFDDKDKRFWLTNNTAWILASVNTNKISPRDDVLERKELIENIYRLVSSKSQYPPINNPDLIGRMDLDEMQKVQSGQESYRWYAREKKRIARVMVPIINPTEPNKVLGAVVAEQSTDLFIDLINSAFGRLILYAFVVSAGLVLVLLAYASWISLRVRRLSRSAELAVDESGKIKSNFNASRAKDEIGDLSRSYKRLLDRLGQYNAYLETLASKLSHELRTPLAIVKSSLDNLEHHELPKETKVYTERANEGLERLSSILNAMSAASRMEHSIAQSEKENVDLVDLLTQLTKAYQDVYQGHMITFEANSLSDAKVLVSAELIVQMLDKLVDNATEFSPESEPVVLTLDKDTDTYVLRVINSGPALPENPSRLFESMVSERENIGGEGGHLGLGLYIVRLIADFHGARVTAYNRPDEKVVFEIRLF